MPLSGSVARFSAIAERNARGLLVKPQNILVTLHPVNRPKLHAIAFKLDGDAHLGARIAPGDVTSAPTYPANWGRLANGFDERLSLGTQPQLLAPGMECFGRHSHDHLPSRRARLGYLLLSQEQVYLRFARNATFFMHFLAYLSYILANEPQESDEKGKGKRKKGSFRCSAILCEKAHPLNELGSVASYMRNQRRITDK